MDFALPERWPEPADRAAASRLLDDIGALDPGLARLTASPAPRAMLACLGGNSPYLAGLVRRDPAGLRRLVREGPEAVRLAAMARLAAVSPGAARAEVAAGLRAAKRQVALAVAVADLGGLWPLEQVTGALSDLADACLRLAVSHLLLAARADGLRLARARHDAAAGTPAAGSAVTRRRARDLGPGSGFVVLAMGKLGARELNYSSDVDLVLLYDPACHSYHGAAERAPDLAAVFNRLARGLVALMEAGEDGFVFRTDLRLRPDPAATPLAISLPAALGYYETMGRNWERAAMIKARPAAGDLALGRTFLERIRPFIWRRHLDFAAIADIAGMKQRIDLHQRADPHTLGPGGPPGSGKPGGAPGAGAQADGEGPRGSEGRGGAIRLLGHDLKLGRGGIREIEFLAQTLQLVWGGRDPALREPGTVAALQRLAQAGRIEPALAEALVAAYRVLRGAEHRLQMVADRQTHSLPATPAGFAAFAVFMGLAAAADLDAMLLAELRAVHAAFDALAGGTERRRGGTQEGAGAQEGADVRERTGAGGAERRGGGPDEVWRCGAVVARFGQAAELSGLAIGEGAEAIAPATLTALAGLGFARPETAIEILRGWRAGRPRALRSERARALIARLTPALLAALQAARAGPLRPVEEGAGPVAGVRPGRAAEAGGPQIDRLLARFDTLLGALPAGVQLLSLFERNPALLGRVATVLAAAPSLADHLQAAPSAIEGLLGLEDIDPEPQHSLDLQLGDADALEPALAVAQRFLRGEEFRLSCAQLEGRINPDRAGAARSALADAVLGALLPRVMAEHERRHGAVRGGGMAVVALGKAGGREMMAGSDLDLLLIYDHPDDVAESGAVAAAGARGGPGGQAGAGLAGAALAGAGLAGAGLAGPAARLLPVSQYYIRAAHALVGALTSQGREGPLYAVDMRLRPSGSKGPVAVSLAGFVRYHAAEAWTWERMALTRARVVAGPPALRARVEAAIRVALGAPGRTAAAERGAIILGDAAAMRSRLERDLPAAGRWDVKHRRGGLMEVEFVAQALQLVHAARCDAPLRPNTADALRALVAAGVLDQADAAVLVRADLVWRKVQGLLRIAVGPRLPDALPTAALHWLACDLAGDLDMGDGPGEEDALHAAFDELGEAVRRVFVRLVGLVGAA